MLRLRNFLPLAVAALVGAAVLGAPSKADAAFSIYLQEDAGPVTLVASGADFTAVVFNGTFGPTGIGGTDFSVTLFGASSDNGAALSDLLSATTSVRNLTNTTHTLRLYASQTNYTLPPTSELNVVSGLGGTLNTGTLNLTNIFQAFADQGNNLLGMSDFTNGPQTATLNGNTFDTGSAHGVFDRTGAYSLTSLVTLQLSGGGQANFGSNITVTAVPAPAGLVLALTALPCLGIGTWLRRRRAEAQGN